MGKQRGLVLALASFVIWGLFPLYFGMLHSVDPLRVLAHRAVWSGVLSVGLLFALREPLRQLRVSGALLATLKRLGVTAALLGVNWGVYLYAVHAGRVLESSLGYFINPLVSVVLGVVFLRERLSVANRAGVALALLAVTWLAFMGGAFPAVAVFLALTFGTYGLLRKRLTVNPLLASALEALMMMPVGALFLVLTHDAAPPTPLGVDALLVASGAVTLVPLLMFNLGAQSLRYSTLGLLQYVTPTLQFACAVVAFHEPVDHAQLMAFALIWLAIGISSAEAVRSFFRSHPAWAARLGRPAAAPLR